MVDTTETIFPPYNRKLIDMGDGTYAEQVVATPPDILTTGTTNPRLRVDVGQTGFFEKREYRTFRRLSIAAGTEVIIRAVVPINIILFGLEIGIYTGLLDLETKVGGTPGGTFSEVLPIFPRNTMTELPPPAVPAQVVLTAGGTHTGGTVLDVLIIKAADNSNFASSVTGEGGDERGVGANTYYFRLQAIAGQGNVEGVFKARWEERP